MEVRGGFVIRHGFLVLISALCRCLLSWKSWGNGRVKLGGHWGRSYMTGGNSAKLRKGLHAGFSHPTEHFR